MFAVFTPAHVFITGNLKVWLSGLAFSEFLVEAPLHGCVGYARVVAFLLRMGSCWWSGATCG